MSAISRSLVTFSAVFVLCSSAFADTITLATGEKIEGKITAETDTEVTVDVKISASVTDQQTIPKANIAKIEKEQPDEVAWQALKDLKPGANSLPAEQYEKFLGPLKSFVTEFPNSPHAGEANQSIAIFAGEKTRVDGGEVRLGEKWLSAEDVAKERYQIGGLLAGQFMRSQRAAGDLIGTLNTFEQIEKNYPGAKSFPDAVEAAREAVGTLRGAIERAQQAYRVQQAEFEQGVAAAGPGRREELIAARKRELDQGEAAVEAAEKAKIKWPTLFVRSDKNLEAIAKKITEAEKHLASIDLAKLRQSSELAEKAQSELATGNTEAAQNLAKALALWPQNELAKRLRPEATALKAATPAPVIAEATPVPATPRPTPVHQAAAVIAPPPPEPERSFFQTPGGIITCVIGLSVIVGGLLVFRKIKGRANEILE